ncbi:hypothetical protein SLA2020_299810 [Shorea laevis]
MSGNGHCFVEWKEEFVSQERGNRVVHYFLKDSAGESILAVVGTERSVRHMFYVVAEEFVKLYGPEHSINVGFKWRSRREVVDWLTSMLSKQHLQGDQSKSPKHGAVPPTGTPESAVSIGSKKAQVPNNLGCLSRNLSGHSSDIVWSGSAWTCGKQLKHYPAFGRNGTKIAIQSFVFVMAKEENHYVAYLEDMYEDKRGQKKVKVRWFHHNKEVKGVIPVKNPHPKEVFITPYSQVISAECVDGPATVLTREHYEQCLDTFPNALLARVHLCYRQFRSNRVKPFDLRKLRGYLDQPILSCLNSSIFAEPDSISHGVNEEEEELSLGEEVKLGNKRTRTERGFHSMDYEFSYKNIKYGFSSKRLLSLKHVDSRSWPHPVFKVDEKIELLCQDSGIRGCWFRCTILQVDRKQMKVQYDDLQDEDGYGNLEEWIPAFKLAVPDKLGMRCSGRPTIRPSPPSAQTDLVLQVGIAVDAWWSDGWWEGVITGVNNGGEDSMQVYFPGENLSLNINKKDLRISRDWVGDQWIDVEAKPNILRVITAAASLDTKVSISSVAKDDNSNNFATPVSEVPTAPKADSVQEHTPQLAIQGCSNIILEDLDCIDGNKPGISNDEKDEGDSDGKEPPLKNESDGDGGDDTNNALGKSDNLEGDNNSGNDRGNESNDLKEGRLEMELENSENCKSAKLMEVTS